MPPASSRKAAIHEDSSDHDQANSSQEWDVREILDERGPAGGDEGRYFIDWADTSSGTAFPRSWERKDGCTPALVKEWKKKKKADPSIVGRFGGELEEQYESSKTAGPSNKRSRSRVASGSHPPSSDIDEPNAKKRKPRISAPPRVKHGWEYVEVSSQEPKHQKISIEAEIRRRKKEGLPPLPIEGLDDEKPNIRATRVRSRDASGSKPPSTRPNASTPSTVSPKTESRTGASPRHAKMGRPSTSANPSPSRPITSHDKNLPTGRRPRGRPPKKATSNAATSQNPSPTKSKSHATAPDVAGTSKQKAPARSAEQPQFPSPPGDAEMSAPPEGLTTAASPSKPLAESRSAPARLGPVRNISSSQFKSMVQPAIPADALSKPRSPSPSQDDTIAHFSSPVAGNGQASRGKPKLTAQPGGPAGRGSADAEQVDSSLEVGEESGSQNSTEEDVQAEIVTEVVDGVQITRVATEPDKRTERARPADGAADEESSQESSEEDVSHMQVEMVTIDGEEVIGIRERVAEEPKGTGDGPVVESIVQEVVKAVEAVVEDTESGVEDAAGIPKVARVAPEPALKELPEQAGVSGPAAVSRTAAAADHGPTVDEALPPSESVRQAIVSTLDHPSPSRPVQPASLPSHDQQIAEQTTRIRELEEMVARLQNSYDNTLNDNTFLRQAYQDASSKAVQEVRRNDALEEEMKILRGQLKFGLKQKEMFSAAIEKKRDLETTRLQMQNKVLLDQSRLTDDDVRRRASAYGKMKHERDQLLQKNGELHQKYEALSERNEELVDQVHYFRAKQMGVFGSDSEDDDDNEGEWDEDDAEASMLNRGTRGRRSDPVMGHAETSQHNSLPNGSGTQSDHGDVFTASQVLPSDSQFPQTHAQTDEGVYRSGLYSCKWMEPERCTAVFDNHEAFGRHVEAHADAQL